MLGPTNRNDGRSTVTSWQQFSIHSFTNQEIICFIIGPRGSCVTTSFTQTTKLTPKEARSSFVANLWLLTQCCSKYCLWDQIFLHHVKPSGCEVWNNYNDTLYFQMITQSCEQSEPILIHFVHRSIFLFACI